MSAFGCQADMPFFGNRLFAMTRRANKPVAAAEIKSKGSAVMLPQRAIAPSIQPTLNVAIYRAEKLLPLTRALALGRAALGRLA